MTRFALLLLLAPAAAADDLRWHDATAPDGRGWPDTKHRFDRLPARAESAVRPPVWSLAQHAAGLGVRFETDASTIAVRWTLRGDRLAMPHMPATGVSGVDLYARQPGGGWRFVGVGQPRKSPGNEAVLASGLAPGSREYRLNLPLYNGVEKVAVGVPAGAAFRFLPVADAKPVVVYGTSITQGGCASRPGMAYPAILARRLDVPFVNLGFSGNGKTEPEMANLLAELDPSAYVLDSLPNLDAAQVAERLPPFVAALRAKHPTTPIVLVENIDYPDGWAVPKRSAKARDANEYLRKLYADRTAAGDKHLYYVQARDLLGGDADTTVDGTHPTDLGFVRLADAVEPALRRALRPADDEAGFVPLFDGKTLAGWKKHDDVPKEHVGGKWTVRPDGVLVGDQDPPGKGGFLVTERSYRDFVFRCELQMDYPTDTGVFLRVGPDGKSHQVSLDNRPLGQFGSIYLPWTRGRVHPSLDGVKAFKPNEWNRIEVRIAGEPARIRFTLNDTLVTDFQHTAESTAGVPTAGFLGLQVHPTVPNLTVWKDGNTVRYRNIRIRTLDPPPLRASYLHLHRVLEPDSDKGTQEKLLGALLDRFKASGLEVVLPYATGTGGQAYYGSGLHKAVHFTKSDPLAVLTAAARDRGLKVWPVVCVVSCGGETPAGALLDHPGWGLRHPDGSPLGYLSPAHPDARAWSVKVVTDVAEKYRPEGVLLDYIRFHNRPLRLDPAAEERFREVLPPDCPPAEEARRLQAVKEEAVTELVKDIRMGLNAARPGTALGAYCWGAHTVTNHLTAQVWDRWVDRGYLDLVNVSGYAFPKELGDKYLAVFDKRMRDAVAVNERARSPARMTFALGVATSHGEVRSADDIRQYLALASKAGQRGVAFFSWNALDRYLDELTAADDIRRFPGR